MNLYKECKKELKTEKEIRTLNSNNTKDIIQGEYERITKLLSSVGLKSELTFDRHFFEITIFLDPKSKTGYTKSKIRINPKVEYYCNHYSVRGWSVNEVLSEKFEPTNDNELLELIKKDLKEVQKIANHRKQRQAFMEEQRQKN